MLGGKGSKEFQTGLSLTSFPEQDLGFSISFMKLYGRFPQIPFAKVQMSSYLFALTLTHLYKEFDSSGRKY